MANLSSTRDWNVLIEDVVAGRWRDPETGQPASVPFRTILLAENLDGAAADLVRPLDLGRRLAVVADEHTAEIMGRRVARELGDAELVILTGDIETDEDTIALVSERTRHADGLVAVGSGALCDSVKYATFKDGRAYACFGTAASMNGYAASTASVTLRSGLKTSLPAHAPRGIFLDLSVSAAAPAWLSAAGLGDSLCRPTAQVDWWLSHRLFGTMYSTTPYVLQGDDEAEMLARAAGLAKGDIEAVGVLQRVLTLTGLGVCFTKVSHHGSMGEHQISHWIDMFAGDAHPGSVHGTQVGIASLTMARLQAEILAEDSPPVVRPTVVDEAGMRSRYGEALAAPMIADCHKKALDQAGADALNAKLEDLWSVLRLELMAHTMPVETMRSALKAAGGPTTAAEMGLDSALYRQAILHAHEVRNRYSFLDLARDAGLLDAFAAGET